MIVASQTLLKAFGDCYRQAYYRIIKEEAPETASLVAGRIIHDMVDHYENTAKVPDVLTLYRKKLAKALDDDELIFFSRQSPAFFLDWMDKCFRNYKAISDKLPAIVSSEQWFSVKYPDWADDEEVEIHGIFDQVREGDVIVELKTSKRCPSEEFLRADIQATVYIWAYIEMYGVVPTYYYVHLPTGSVFELERESFAYFHDLMAEFIDVYKAKRWTRKRNGRKCDWCWYKDACLQSSEVSRFVFKAVGKPKNNNNKKRVDFFTY